MGNGRCNSAFIFHLIFFFFWLFWWPMPLDQSPNIVWICIAIVHCAKMLKWWPSTKWLHFRVKLALCFPLLASFLCVRLLWNWIGFQFMVVFSWINARFCFGVSISFIFGFESFSFGSFRSKLLRFNTNSNSIGFGIWIRNWTFSHTLRFGAFQSLLTTCQNLI